ncbi:MAG: nucleotidyltransferase family protein [Candidatus Altiarchaeota archaeon]|nr:nucleotidyltransferase family protein [Candidatus Altiarchaeota archaeon]
MRMLREHDDVLRRYGVKRIGLFGSYARGEQTLDSDMDFLVEFEEPSFDDFMDLSFYLEDLFGLKVELVTTQGLSKHVEPYVRREVVWYET